MNPLRKYKVIMDKAIRIDNRLYELREEDERYDP